MNANQGDPVRPIWRRGASETDVTSWGICSQGHFGLLKTRCSSRWTPARGVRFDSYGDGDPVKDRVTGWEIGSQGHFGLLKTCWQQVFWAVIPAGLPNERPELPVPV